MKKMFSYLFFLFSLAAFSQKSCIPLNRAFKEGEQLNYIIYYNWGILRMDAGEASLRVLLTNVNENMAYHFIGHGENFPQFNWFFKVNDKYESFADTFELKPFRFVREVNEGRYYAYDDYIFNNPQKQVYITEKRNNKEIKFDTLSIASCVKDIVTTMYYVRCLDFTNYKLNDIIPVPFVLDGKAYPSYIRYIGKEIIETELWGTVRCIKLKPQLIEGNIFKGGEGMTIWVTDDKNKIPVYIETAILVGALKVKLIKYSGLRNKIDCFVPQ